MANIEMANMLIKMEQERKRRADDLLLYTLYEDGWKPEEIELFVASESMILRTMVLTNLRSRIESAKDQTE